MFLVLLVLLAISFLIIVLVTPRTRIFLSRDEVLRLFVGNSEIGLTNNTQSIYELYFPNDHDVIMRKRKEGKCEIHNGTWTVASDGTITSHWPTYSSMKYVIKYVYLGRDTFSVYNVEDACGPAGTICREFIRVPGNIFDTVIC